MRVGDLVTRAWNGSRAFELNQFSEGALLSIYQVKCTVERWFHGPRWAALSWLKSLSIVLLAGALLGCHLVKSTTLLLTGLAIAFIACCCIALGSIMGS